MGLFLSLSFKIPASHFVCTCAKPKLNRFSISLYVFVNIFLTFHNNLKRKLSHALGIVPRHPARPRICSRRNESFVSENWRVSLPIGSSLSHISVHCPHHSTELLSFPFLVQGTYVFYWSELTLDPGSSKSGDV